MNNRLLRLAAKFLAVASMVISSAASYAAHDPVIMIPGMGGGIENMYPMRDNLKANGWAADRLFPWTDADMMNKDMEASARAISAKVDQVLAQTGASKVVLATWSASTIAGRYYMKNLGGAGKVSQFISFAGPHHGISIWQNCTTAQTACRNQWGPMNPNTPWLIALNSGTEVPGSPAVAYLALRGSMDYNATPISTAILAGADENYLANGQDHFSIIKDPTTLAKMRSFIIANETTGPTAVMTSCSGTAVSSTSANVKGAATQDVAPVVSYRVQLAGPTAINDAAAGSGASFSKTYGLSNGYYTGTVTATNSLGNTSRPCTLPEFLVGQPKYTQAVSAEVWAHYNAGRINVTQYNQLGAKYGYNTVITLYQCGASWTNDRNCGPMN